MYPPALSTLAATVAQPSAVGTSSIIGRFGVDDGVELRVRAPDIVLYDGEVGTGFVGLGAKIGGNVSERWSVSVKRRTRSSARRSSPTTSPLSDATGC